MLKKLDLGSHNFPWYIPTILRLCMENCVHGTVRSTKIVLSKGFLTRKLNLKSILRGLPMPVIPPSSVKIFATPIGWLMYGVCSGSFLLSSRCFRAAKSAANIILSISEGEIKSQLFFRRINDMKQTMVCVGRWEFCFFFEKPAITSRILRIRTEHTESKIA